MGKHYRCVNDTADDMQYPELHKRHSNLDEDMFKKRFLFWQKHGIGISFYIWTTQLSTDHFSTK